MDVSNDLASANLRFTQPLPLRRGHLALTATLEGHGHFLGFSLSLVSCFGFGVEGFRHVGSFGGLQSYLFSADECLWGCSMNVNTLCLFRSAASHGNACVAENYLSPSSLHEPYRNRSNDYWHHRFDCECEGSHYGGGDAATAATIILCDDDCPLQPSP